MSQLVSRADSVWSGSLVLPLLKLSPTDFFTVRDACENTICIGGIGSGKTTGPARALRRALFSAGAGALVLVNKPDEVAACIEDARATGRMASVICIDGKAGFNFLEHELRRHGLDGVNTVVEFLLRVLEMIRVAMPGASRQGDEFWTNSTRLLLRMVVPPLYAAYGTVRIADIIRFVLSAPASAAELDDDGWQQRSFMCETVLRAARAPVHALDPEAMDRIVSYFRDEFARMDVKLRSSITATLSTSLDRFTHGRLKRLFCEETSFFPELTLLGAVLILNMPVLEWNEDGLIAQQIIKYAWQRVVLSRNALPPRYRDRLVCCFADEAQTFLNSYDREFLSLSRSSRCSTIFITQSIPSVIATIGSDQPKHQADALLAQFGTKIFCNNSCPETNRFAADTIGRAIQRRSTFSESQSSGRSGGLNMGEGSNFGTNSSHSVSPDGKGGFNHSFSSGTSSGYNESTGRNRGFTTGESVSSGFSEAMDYEIEPGEFARSLTTGGPSNGGVVSCVWFQAGRRFSVTSRPWLVASFRQ